MPSIRLELALPSWPWRISPIFSFPPLPPISQDRAASPAYVQVKEELRARLLDWIERAEGVRPTITD